MLNIFQFLENTKGKRIPLKFKLLNNLPLSKDESTLDYDTGCTFFRRSEISVLPNNLTVKCFLSLAYTKIKKLPRNLTVEEWLDISNTKISYLPKNLIVLDDLFCENTPLADKIMKDYSLLEKYSKQVKGKIIY